MLRKNYLFELIKSLDVHEKRYLMSKGKSGDQITAYSAIISCIYRMEEYSETKLQKVVRELSVSNKTDVKKHYLYHWILKHLYDYHSSKYSNLGEIRNIQLLVDRSLIHHASALIPAIKSKIIESEHYIDLMMLLEIELRVQKYKNTGDSINVMQELIFYSKRFSDLKQLEHIRNQFRKILDRNVFPRTREEQDKIYALFKERINRFKWDEDSFLFNFNYNLLYYWKSGTDNNWVRAFKYARDNFDLLKRHPKSIIHFPDVVLQILYNFIVSAAIVKNPACQKGFQYLRRLANQKLTKRMKDDIFFNLHLARLIQFNRNRSDTHDSRFITEAEHFIEQHRDCFSAIRINNFYFDLSKAFFYTGDIKKSYMLLNKIYQEYYTLDQTIDFLTHSRLLYCLVCYEIGNIDLLLSTAKSVSEFVKKNNVNHLFEKRIIGFISRVLPVFANKSMKEKRACFQILKSDMQILFKSEYERKVLNYFDYTYWVDKKLHDFQYERIRNG